VASDQLQRGQTDATSFSGAARADTRLGLVGRRKINSRGVVLSLLYSNKLLQIVFTLGLEKNHDFFFK